MASAGAADFLVTGPIGKASTWRLFMPTVTARAAFMQRLVEGYGFTPLSREVAAKHAQRRVERGYVNLYQAFRDTRTGTAR
jgi:hypothetical protein